ncbi:RHS repeat domain-containing protein [Pseudomonas laurylsulfatiphila]|uniref:RHS repeat domain-containing protein n=1 Tax=Pseudomonas laurylsulfatiphila TaxID=2011015 RepID=UPI003D1D2505
MSVDHAHHGTPTLAVSDSRGLAVRAIQYHRRQAADPVETRVTHQCFDAAGRPVAGRDPYLFAFAQTDASVPVNLSQVFSLSGVPLASDSVDAGWRVALQGAAGQIVERWDGRGSRTLTEFDALMRPVAVRERGGDGAEHVLERFTYAGVEADTAVHNLCGQLIRHDDPAGTLHLKELGLGGAVLQQTRHFLRDADTPDWPASEAARDALLETGDGATTSHVYSPGAEPLQQTDALGNRQHFAYTVAGELKDTRLTLVGEDEMTLVSDLHYNASGQIEAETAGNRVITRHRYDLADGRLIGLSAHKADGTPLQDLRYSYDASGNVLSLEDAAQPIRYFNNQRIEPLKTYRYDTLDQLIEARGWEAKTGHGGPALPDLQPLPLDPGQIANYTQTYHYDAGSNLLNLVHVGAQAHGRLLTRAQYSNRCLPERNGRPPTEAELAAGFDANGNLRELQAGQSMEWDLRNQLTVVHPVVREEAEDDYERYIYDGGGQRLRKLRANQTNARTLISEVRYLPGVEIRSHGGTGEVLHVITASAGSNSVQVLHWVSQPPAGISNNQVRYSLNDHLQSSTMGLDQNADLISQEWYYPFGGTACFAARSATEAKYKTVRYSGKERDATGLYYYGFRYYAPWLQRWINPDPAGYVDGMNLFAMVRNRPINFGDQDGNIGKELTQDEMNSIEGQLIENKELLPEADLISVATSYLETKKVQPEKYIDYFRVRLGFIGQPEAYDRPLTADEKEGMQLIWGTNAGALYFKGHSRNHYENNPSDIIKKSLSETRKSVYSELKNNDGDYGTVKLTPARKQKVYDPAMELLESHARDSKKTISLLASSLGPQMTGEFYRGTRLQNPDSIEVGDILQTSIFTAFTPNKKTAKKFIDKLHVPSTLRPTLPALLKTTGNAFRVDHTPETEGIFKPMSQFKVDKIFKDPFGVYHIEIAQRKFVATPNAKWI